MNAVDIRKHTFTAPHAGSLTQDKQNVILQSYVVWQVSDPLLFLKSTKTVDEAEIKLQSSVVSEINTFLGTYNLNTLISTTPEHAEVISRLENQICGAVKEKHLGAGIEVLQVGIRRISFPEGPIEATLDKMSAERRAAATIIRENGKTEAARIVNESTVTAAEIVARGTQEAGRIIADARARAAAIYDASHQLDPDFYRFWRQTEVLRKTIGARTTMVLQNESGIFSLLFEMPKPGITPAVIAPLPAEDIASPEEETPVPEPIPAPESETVSQTATLIIPVETPAVSPAVTPAAKPAPVVNRGRQSTWRKPVPR